MWFWGDSTCVPRREGVTSVRGFPGRIASNQSARCTVRWCRILEVSLRQQTHFRKGWLSSIRSASVSTTVFPMNTITLPFQLLQSTSRPFNSWSAPQPSSAIVLYLLHLENRVRTNLFQRSIRLQTHRSFTYASFHFPSRQSVEFISRNHPPYFRHQTGSR
jgi:hypothetical protein